MDTHKQAQIETYADRIESLLKKHNLSARITGVAVFPYAIHFSTGAFILDGHQQKIISDLQDCLEGMRVRIDGASIIAEKPIDTVAMVAKIRDAMPKKTALLGVCDDGAPSLIRVLSQSVGNVLITGPDRAANTSLLRSIVISLAMTNTSADLGMLLIGDSLADLFKQLPHCRRFAIASSLISIIDEPQDISMHVNVNDHAARFIVATSRSLSSCGYGTIIRQTIAPDHFECLNSGQSCAFRAAQYL